MDKKKVLTALSILGLSGGLMFSVSALSADTPLNTLPSNGSITALSHNGSGQGPDCEGGSANSSHCRASAQP